MSARVALPVDDHLEEVRTILRDGVNLVLTAEPGAGKTTRIPPAVLDVLDARHPGVVVLEPRRLAARLAAQRVAQEMSSKLGGTVGYQVRFEDVTSAQTRLRFVTEGILVRQLLGSTDLKGVGAVVLDEFHERHIHADLALSLLRRLQQTIRPDLRLVVMSATLDALPVARFLGDCPVKQVAGRVFPVDVEFAATPEPTVGGRHLDKQVADAVAGLLRRGLEGDVLVFLPGMAEIRRAQEALSGLARRENLVVAVLHAELPPEEQQLALGPNARRKIILSTNVAESSVTIDGVAAVVDSGLARIPSHASWSGLPVLKLAKISRASATQRAGRAGRTRAGVCVRLYTRHDHDSRPDHTPPEIKRLDLAETALTLHGVDVTDLSTFPFYDRPDASSLNAAESLLRQLLAVDETGALTPLGRQMLRFPLHPRQSRVLLEAARRGYPWEGCLTAAILGEGDILATDAARRNHRCDVMAAVDAMETAMTGGSLARQASAAGLDVGAALRVERSAKQLQNALRGVLPAPAKPDGDEHTALQLALLTGYVDRLAMRRPKDRTPDAPYLLATGGTARMVQTSAAAGSDLVLALEVEERVGGRNDGARISLASGLELDWLLDAVPHLLEDVTDVEWNAQAQRVEVFSRLKLLALTLEEKRVDHSEDPRVAQLLVKQALQSGLGSFCDVEKLALFRARLRLAGQHFPELEFPTLSDEDLKRALSEACAGLRTFKELQDSDVLSLLHNRLTHEQQQLLGQDVPDEIRLPGGRKTRVFYVEGQPPWVESRLQDFFGQLLTPRILKGRVPLNVHLLAPNHRAVQITNDLSGFWQRHYPAVRKELMRKYPRHFWPEDPATAEPPPPRTRPPR